MMIKNQKSIFLSLHQKFHSHLKFNSPISRSSTTSFQFQNPNPNPNFRSFSYSIQRHRHFTARCLISYNYSSPLISNSSFRSCFNGGRTFATRLGESSNRPPKETIMLEGCDFEHWLVVVEPPDENLTRDEIIDGYIKTLAHVFESEMEARMKIYSVSTRHYYAFGALVSEELADKLKEQPHVRWVLPDSYFDVKNKTYAGEPFINGQPVPYDPKYHEIWLRNHEQSVKNNMKPRKPRDPNSSRPRSRSLPSVSATSSLNQNWMPAAGSQNQAPQTSNMPNRRPQLLSSSNPDVSCPNTMTSAGSSNQALPQSQMQNPASPPFSRSRIPEYSGRQNHSSPSTTPSSPASAASDPNCQSVGNQNTNWTSVTGSQNQVPHQMQKQTSSTFSQSQGSQHSQMQNHPSPWTSTAPPSSATMNANCESWGSQSPNWTPVTGSQNRALHPSQMHKQTSPPSPTSKPYASIWNGRSQSWEPTSGYQGYQSQSQPPSISNNNYSYDNLPPPAAARDMPSHMLSPDIRGQSVPPQVQQHNYSGRDIPHHVRNSGSQNIYPPETESPDHQQYQNSHTNMQSSKDAVSPQRDWNYQKTNVTASAPGRDKPSHRQYPNFHGGAVPSPLKQNSNSYRDMAYDAQNGGSQDGNMSMGLQHQQYQNGYRDLQSSTMVSSQGGWNCQSANLTHAAPPRDMGSHMQNPDFYTESRPFPAQRNGYSDGDIPHDVGNGGSRNGYPSHASQHHHFQNTSKGLQSSDVMESPQDWNKQNLTPPLQNSSIPNTNMTHLVQNHWSSQGPDVPRAVQNNEYGRDAGQAPKQVDNYSRGAIPSYTTFGNVQTREYQEPDMPTDKEYAYASK